MDIQIEILESNYWEHFRMAKDLSLYLPIDNPKRLRIESALNDIQKQIKVSIGENTK